MYIPARLKSGAGWDDACIVDVSRRGVGLKAESAPSRGAYVEIRRGMHVIVARVVWSVGQRFGVAAQDDIPIGLIAADQAPPPEPPKAVASADRRRAQRRLANRAEASRTWGRRLQFVAVAVAGLAAAMVVGAQVRSAFAAPLGQVSDVLGR